VSFRWVGTLSIVLLASLVPLGCGGGDGGDSPSTTSPAPTEDVALIQRPPGLSGEASAAADVVVELLELPSGAEACFALIGTEYLDSLGGEEVCARRFDPVVTGDYDTIASVRILKPEVEAAAEVTAPGGAPRVTLKLAMATTGWRIDGATGLPDGR